MKKTKIQIVGNYYAPALNGKLPEEIYVQNCISGISPITLTGKNDQKLIEEWEPKIKDLKFWNDKLSNNLLNCQVATLLSLKKNFSNLLSRDKNTYCDNTIYYQFGREVVYQNEADYILLDNSAVVYSLIEYHGCFYTDNWPTSPFTEFLRKQSDAIKFNPAAREDFNWKHYFDKLINSLLEEYSKSKIILIRTPYSKFYYSDNSLHWFSNLNPKTGKLINEIDDYFIENTDCHVIDLLCDKIPNQNLVCGWPYGASLSGWQDYAVKEVKKIINGNLEIQNNSIAYFTPLASHLSKKLREDKKQQISAVIDLIEKNRIPSIEQLSKFEYEYHIFAEKINDLMNIKSLSDYIRNILSEDLTRFEKSLNFDLIKKYVEYFTCDINDILSIYYAYTLSKDPKFKEIAAIISTQTDSLPIKHCNALLRENLQTLSCYEYINHQHLENITIDKKYIFLCDDITLIIDKNSQSPFSLVKNLTCKTLEHNLIIDNGYKCNIEVADALTFSYDYYVEKAKRGDGAIPTYLMFEQKENFLDSLCYIDYTELLKNEKFVFVIENDEIIRPDNYIPIVDLTELLNPDLSVVRISSGLGDQISRYVLGQLIEKYTYKSVIYDDIATTEFNGFEVDKLVKDKMNLLSSKLSDHLSQKNLFEKVFSKISSNYTYITQNADWVPKQAGQPYYVAGKNIKNLLELNIPYRYFNVLYGTEKFKLFYDFDLSEFIEFPPFKSEEQKNLADKIRSCDSIVLHVRRGDYVSWGWETNSEYYVEAIEKIMKLENYTNKKFFVFSDDINWCRNNKKDLGLENVDNCEVIFVDLNKTDESFRDMQLMSLGKVIISGESHFARIAALYSKSWEIYCNSNSNTNELYQTHVRKNKYDIGKFSKDFSTDRRSKHPKDNNIKTEPTLLSSSMSTASNPKIIRGGVITGREYVEWLNFWFDYANEKRSDRILLIGDSIARDYRGPLAQLTQKPVDFFATTTNISDDKFYRTLDLFFSYEEYHQQKAQIQIGVHGIDGVCKAVQSNSIEKFEKEYEKLVNYVLKYIPDLTIALTTHVVENSNLSKLWEKVNNEIIKRNQVAKKIAEKYKLKVNDLYSLMFNEPHRDWAHFPKEGSEKIARKVAEVMKLI